MGSLLEVAQVVEIVSLCLWGCDVHIVISILECCLHLKWFHNYDIHGYNFFRFRSKKKIIFVYEKNRAKEHIEKECLKIVDGMEVCESRDFMDFIYVKSELVFSQRSHIAPAYFFPCRTSWNNRWISCRRVRGVCCSKCQWQGSLILSI